MPECRHALLMAQFWGAGKHLSGNILLQNCSSHGYWKKAMWEVAESISTAIAPPLPEPTEVLSHASHCVMHDVAQGFV